MEKIEDMTVSSRSISGFGSGSNRSNRSEEDVFADAVADFPDVASDSDDVRKSAKNRDFSEEKDVVDAGSGETLKIDVLSQYHLPSSTLDSSSDSGLAVREEENSVDLAHSEKELVGHSEENLNEEFLSNMSMAEPTERIEKISGDVISEALHQKDNFSEEVSVEKETEKTDSHASDEGKTITKEHNPLIFAEEVFLEKETEQNDSHDSDEDKTITEERNPSVFAEEVSVEKETFSFSNNSLAGLSENYVENSTDMISEALHKEDNFAEEVSVEKETEKSYSHATDADILCQDKTNLQSVLFDGGNHSHSVSSVKPVDDDDSEHDKKDDETFFALEAADSFKEAREEFPQTIETSSVSDICNAMEKNLLREEGNGDDYDGNAQIKTLQDSEEVVKDLGSSSELMVIEQSVNVVDNVNVASDSADASHTENDKDNVVQLEKIEVSGGKELENVGEYSFGKVDLGLISDNDDISESTQNAANGSSVEDRLTKERNRTGSTLTDIQADSISQIDSLEGNWGSISVLSTLSDAPPATETGSQPSQESFKPENPILQPKSNNGKSVIFQPQSSISSVEQKAADKTDQNKASPTESSGKKRNEEIIAKVTNWSTGKQQHMPLKSYLGESESSPGSKENPPQMMSQEIINAVMAAKEQVDNEAKVDLSKEWNSPARYQSNIKREKSKVKRPYWAPFICCSSVQTS